MKFSRQYQESLVNEGFPASWVDSAISYRKLKKCIKLLRRELDSLGLDAPTLRKLLERREAVHGKLEEEVDDDGQEVQQPFTYTFDSKQSQPASSNESSRQGSPSIKAKKPILPKLQFVVDEETGEPLGAAFTPETRTYLHQLAVAEQLTSVRIKETVDPTQESTPAVERSDCNNSSVLQRCNSHIEDVEEDPPRRKSSGRPTRLVQIPLVSDSNFFSLLENELMGLATLQKKEQARLTEEIKSVGTMLSRATGSDTKSSRADLAHWRRLFELYLESRVFFIATEKDHSTYGSSKAGKQWNEFLNKAKETKLLEKWKMPESKATLTKFLAVNMELLKSLKFQEMNQTAMAKILKKFDKRTSLGATNSFTQHFSLSVVPQDFSKALCAEVSGSILSIVPQLDDYLCPICMSIAYRPVRLKCGHHFCIRCLIVLQRQQTRRCALCREDVVMEADSTCLDTSMANFMRRFFPDEVKEKQRSNEHAASVDRFGEWAEEKCTLM